MDENPPPYDRNDSSSSSNAARSPPSFPLPSQELYRARQITPGALPPPSRPIAVLPPQGRVSTPGAIPPPSNMRRKALEAEEESRSGSRERGAPAFRETPGAIPAGSRVADAFSCNRVNRLPPTVPSQQTFSFRVRRDSSREGPVFTVKDDNSAQYQYHLILNISTRSDFELTLTTARDPKTPFLAGSNSATLGNDLLLSGHSDGWKRKMDYEPVSWMNRSRGHKFLGFDGTTRYTWREDPEIVAGGSVLTRKVNGIKELVAIWSSTSLSPVGEGHLQIYPGHDWELELILISALALEEFHRRTRDSSSLRTYATTHQSMFNVFSNSTF